MGNVALKTVMNNVMAVLHGVGVQYSVNEHSIEENPRDGVETLHYNDKDFSDKFGRYARKDCYSKPQAVCWWASGDEVVIQFYSYYQLRQSNWYTFLIENGFASEQEVKEMYGDPDPQPQYWNVAIDPYNQLTEFVHMYAQYFW